ncbi:MAG: TspO protein [Spirulina sp. SIO3F2]|nr:TspO protein [Spirulina sp. SIO3F2]
MIPAWILIPAIAIAVAFGLNRLSQRDIRWFFQLRRPRWLTFEGLIPFIWIAILLCGMVSAILAWGASQSWPLMGGYLWVEGAIMAYTPVMCKLRSLTVGTAIGGFGFVLGCILTVYVAQVSGLATLLLLPYLLWSPVGTFVTWQMIKLNPGKA